jgi:kumamolisin
MESEFGVALHTFEAPATSRVGSRRFRSPIGAAQLAPDIAGAVTAVLGLDTRAPYRPQSISSAGRHGSGPFAGMSSAGSSLANPLGALTVLDFAKYYDVEPLYHQNLKGRGTTIGIVTFASFTPSDAFGYWHSLGLNVSAKRITEVQVDGGSGPPSDASGSYETTLDIEQSGGVAPAANIRVYEAPNTSQGFFDAFAAVIDSNTADTISCSWGGDGSSTIRSPRAAGWRILKQVCALRNIKLRASSVPTNCVSFLRLSQKTGYRYLTGLGVYGFDDGRWPAKSGTSRYKNW